MNPEQIFKRLFSSLKLEDQNFHPALVKAIVECFHIPSKKQEETQAKEILQALFTEFQTAIAPSIPFSFEDFIKTYLPNKNETNSFMIAILYGLYYLDIDLRNHYKQDNRENISFLMFQFLAETSSTPTLQKALETLSFDSLVSLTAYALKHYREGSFLILNALQETHPEIQTLVRGIKRNYYDVDLLQELIKKKSTITEHSLKEIILALEERATQETRLAFENFNTLIQSIIHYPLRMFEENVKYRRQILPSFEPIQEEKEHAQQLKASLKESFASVLSPPPTFEEWHNFIRLFGLRGHNPYILSVLNIYKQESFPDKIKLLANLLVDPAAMQNINQNSFLDIVAFALPIGWHIQSLFKNSNSYLKGLHEICFGIPTKGKLLERMPSLPSLLAGLEQLVDCINTHSSKKTSLKEIPIIVYDQSDEELFAKNSLYINKLNLQRHCAILQLSKEQTISLSRKLNIEPLINTTGKGELGYAGARNAVFLLTPVLKEAYQMGFTSPEQLAEMDDKTLHPLFLKHVLGKGPEATDKSILMVDDDMEIPEANIFAHVQFAEKYSHQFYLSLGFNVGRVTKCVPPFPTSNQLLHLEPIVEMFSTTKWDGYMLILAWMSENLTKPSLCLNVPLGSEENQLKINMLYNSMLQYSYHLAGTRYPNKQIPTHFIVGLEDFLKRYIPYYLHTWLGAQFIDAVTFLHNSILPWSHEDFSNLGEAWDFIGREDTKRTLQKKFWQKVHEIFTVKLPNKNDPQTGPIYKLLKMELSAFSEQIESEQFLAHEKESMKKVADLYTAAHKDAILFNEFGLMLIKEIQGKLPTNRQAKEKWFELCIDKKLDLATIVEQLKEDFEKRENSKFSEYPLTHGFYLLIHSAGLADFCNAIKG